jgi:hypothetical protein
MTGHKNCLQAHYKNGRRILLSKLNEVTSNETNSVAFNPQAGYTD